MQVCRGRRVTLFEKKRSSLQNAFDLALQILIRAPTEQPHGYGVQQGQSPPGAHTVPLGLDITMKCFLVYRRSSWLVRGYQRWIALVVAKDDLNYLTRPLLLFPNVIERLKVLFSCLIEGRVRITVEAPDHLGAFRESASPGSRFPLLQFPAQRKAWGSRFCTRLRLPRSVAFCTSAKWRVARLAVLRVRR